MADTKKKNWFVRHKVWSVVLGLIILAIIGSATSSGSDNTQTASTTNASGKSSSKAETFRFADRADKQKGDVELLVGETGSIDGVNLTVTSAQYKTELDEFDTADSGKTYAVVTIKLDNTSNSTRSFNPYDFRIQTASGQVLDPAITGTDTLDSGDLVAGGKVTGNIVYEVPVEQGHEYLIWKPGAFSGRAIVQLK